MFAGKRTMTIGLGAGLLVCIPLISFAEGEEEAQVRAYFSDAPVMMNIAECESKFTQFGKGGTALHGGMGGKMIGIFQVYSDIHADYAEGLGMDIYTTEGNLAYARHLYEREGTKPWLSSFPCWGNKDTSSPENTTVANATANAVLSVNLSMGQEHPQVQTLQKILNSNGFVLTNDGPGSPGNETIKYGALTRDAVRRFQCAQKIVCEGDEYSSGYGFVGVRTRTALLGISTSAIAAPTTAPDPAQSSASNTSTSAVTVVSADTDAEVARLQVQIIELTKLLAELLAKRS
jgi:hypothetical protein